MGRLSGFTCREVVRKLRKIGFEFYRTGKGDHENWFNPHNRLKTIIPHHKEI
ncbi:type II toxin-antitoxin system HicA family toxin [Microcystis aeruginosa]|uniref:type II toxin-antitoxin system HicA family toxin n=1 Tax=Microcystis aeruginosa TaxID=1126 RepID=UPI00232FA9D6|nr:type II toxin-antitoxin system HicA family toxin [Microcystis aeruginosa]MDB9389883.1 type II toxin-antitoxin system HicA family toxin [Microcystis aeruginosa CS-579]